MKAILPCVGILICALPALAQEDIRIQGRFEADSISIGEPIPYALTAQYPRAKQVLFPDSTYSFAPFEIVRKTFFSTRTNGNVSHDSVIYFLTTFEIDSLQRLSLPVFVVQERDCVAVFSRPDSIFLRHLVASIPDSVSVDKLPLKTNTAYQTVQWLLNYPFLSILGFGLLLTGVIVWMVFGKRIRKYLLLRRLNKAYREFIARFNQTIEKVGTDFTERKAEEILVTWKNYMENLEQYPYTKSTSREIVRQASNEDLGKALRAIDRAIYAGLSSSTDPFRFLLTYSEQRFKKKEAEVKNG